MRSTLFIGLPPSPAGLMGHPSTLLRTQPRITSDVLGATDVQKRSYLPNKKAKNKIGKSRPSQQNDPLGGHRGNSNDKKSDEQLHCNICCSSDLLVPCCPKRNQPSRGQRRSPGNSSFSPAFQASATIGGVGPAANQFRSMLTVETVATTTLIGRSRLEFYCSWFS